MSFSESELLPISALQHLLFCERQCALIHVERIWAENRLTAEGRVLHERAHEPGTENRGRTRTVRGLHLRSLKHGLIGVSDIVEFLAPETQRMSAIPEEDFWRTASQIAEWSISPVEYKRGVPKLEKYDEVQLCAQALCLEEMFERPIPTGALFYGLERRRVSIVFDDQLRELTICSARRLREVLLTEALPRAVFKPHCAQCSLSEQCLPRVTSGELSAGDYFGSSIKSALIAAGPRDD